jgi:outer membrane protein OmpA-like peptidoglycan-associated protein
MTPIRRCGRAAGVACLATLAAGCGISSLTNVPGKATSGPALHLTEHVSSSVLVAVASGPGADQSLSALLAATALPREDVAVVRPGVPPRTVVASVSPRPVTVVAPGKPDSPGTGATSYLKAGYNKRLQHWQAEVVADKRAVMIRTQQIVSAWEHGLALPQRLSQSDDGPAASLVQECSVASSVLTGIEQDGRDVGTRRVLLLYPASLTGLLPPGELTGDEVIVVSRELATAAATSAAQADLLAAGAAQAAVLGPETTTAQLTALVTDDLGQARSRDIVSAPVRFANNSSALQPAARQRLAKLVPPLLRPGATAVISGFASTPGTAHANYLLSYARAAAAARYLESRNVPASAMIIVGHGATDLTGPGASGANRRVLVVVQQPAG